MNAYSIYILIGVVIQKVAYTYARCAFEFNYNYSTLTLKFVNLTNITQTKSNLTIVKLIFLRLSSIYTKFNANIVNKPK